MGYDTEIEPKLDELNITRLSPDYVFRATKRAGDGMAGKIPVYPGIGFDVPWNGKHFYSDPERVYQAVVKAFEAGANGIVISREYDEMRVENLRVVSNIS